MPENPNPTQTILLHTALARQGGAARLADTLAAHLTSQNLNPIRSFELRDSDTATGLHLPPNLDANRLAAAWADTLPRNGILHLHSARDWTTTLEAALLCHHPTALTLHDCRLVTGGCVNPLGCENWRNACQNPCPQNLPYPDKRAALWRNLLHRLRPTLISPSRWLGRIAAEALPTLDTRIIPNGVDWTTTPPDKNTARTTLHLPTHAAIALFPAHGGGLSIRCQPGEWESIAAAIQTDIPNTICILAGGTTATSSPTTIHWPYSNHHTFLTLIAAANILVYPSRADNHPLVILESMAQNTPVAAYATGGIPEQIQPSQTGLLTPPGNPTALTTAATSLLRRPTLARKLAATAWATGATRFNAARMAADHARLYANM